MNPPNFGIVVNDQGSISAKNVAAGNQPRAGDTQDVSSRPGEDPLGDLLAQVRMLTASIDEHTTAVREASLALSKEIEPAQQSGRISRVRFAPLFDRLVTSVQSLATLTTAIESLGHAVSHIA